MNFSRIYLFNINKEFVLRHLFFQDVRGIDFVHECLEFEV